MAQENTPANVADLPGKPEVRLTLNDLPKIIALELPSGEIKKFVLDYARRTKGLYLNKIED